MYFAGGSFSLPAQGGGGFFLNMIMLRGAGVLSARVKKGGYLMECEGLADLVKGEATSLRT